MNEKIPMSGEEFLQKIDDGERDFSRINIPRGTDLTRLDGYNEIIREAKYVGNLANNSILDLSFSTMNEINMKKAYLVGMFRDADFSGSNLENSKIYGKLEGVNFENTNLAYAEFKDFEFVGLREILLESSKRVNLDSNFRIIAAREHSFLMGEVLSSRPGFISSCEFKDASLKGANLKDVHLYSCDFFGANLESAYLIGATLRRNNNLDNAFMDFARVSEGQAKSIKESREAYAKRDLKLHIERE
jgi:uncharacterized protein YjbI with pentapeptide repeats